MAISNGLHNPTDSDFVISVRGKQFVLHDDAELVVGIGDHQFMLSLDYASRTVYLTDPKTGEKLNLQVKDAIIDGTSMSQKLDVIQRIQQIVDISTVGLTLVDAKSRVTTEEDYRLNSSTLSGDEDTYKITGLTRDTLIYQMDLEVIRPFETYPDRQHNITVYGENNEILMPATWSDPNVAGCYSTKLNYTVGAKGILTVGHDLRQMTAGVAVLKLYCARPTGTGW